MSDFTLANTYCRNVYNRGGVAIFVRNGLDYKSLDFVNKLSIETICEASAVLIEEFNIIVLSVYRTPKYENFHQFFDVLQSIFNSTFIVQGIYSILLCGDFNVNFLDNCNNNFKNLLCNLMESLCLRFIVNEVTRPGQVKAGTCIDNIATSIHT